MEEIRLLTENDIDVRVAQTNAYEGTVKASLLLYKDARVDMKILDELYTPMGWKRTHRMIGDRLYCCVEVRDPETKEWIAKEDVGTESNTEAEKGQASDSFKRACFNWGIGRELYTAPNISVVLRDKEYSRDNAGRIRVIAKFSVKSIGYDKKARTITSLEIVDRFGNVRYTMGEKAVTTASPAVQQRRNAKKVSPASSEPKAPETATYQPLDRETYWKVIASYAQGKLAKSGEDYRTVFQKMTNAGQPELDRFDADVDDYKYAQG